MEGPLVIRHSLGCGDVWSSGGVARARCRRGVAHRVREQSVVLMLVEMATRCACLIKLNASRETSRRQKRLQP